MPSGHQENCISQQIRLLSCSTGKLPNGFAQYLTNKLGMDVLAPDEVLWAYPNGNMVVAPMSLGGQPVVSQTGQCNLVTPGGGR